MKGEAALSRFQDGKVFDKKSFRDAVRESDPGCSEASISWMLVTLRKQGILASAGFGKYYVVLDVSSHKKEYQYPHSREYMDIEKTISDRFPLICFQMWELIQMNDFVNHQIAKNVIIVEVENMLTDTVYDLLRENHPYTMLQPDIDAFYIQRGPGTDIVVQKLLTEAPSPGENHSCVPEKILVDLLSKKLSGCLIQRSEYHWIYDEIFRKYKIDETKMLRYARRRNLYDTLLDFLNTQTDVKLLTKEIG